MGRIGSGQGCTMFEVRVDLPQLSSMRGMEEESCADTRVGGLKHDIMY